MKRLLPLILLFAGCSGSKPGQSGGTGIPASTLADASRSIPAVALRLPTGGGPLRAYLLPALTNAGWELGGRTSPARAAIGMDDAGRRLLYRDSAGGIEAFDLVAYRERPIEASSAAAGRGTITAMASDGTLFAILPDGTVIESEPWGASEWASSIGRGIREAFAGVGSHLIAVRHAGADSIALASRETGVTVTAPVPLAAASCASRDGDAVAFATDSGLVVVEDREPQSPWFVRLSGSPVGAVFSPSGHRIYVALRSRSELAVVDRFARKARPAIPLPGPAGAMRADPWGRAVLVRPGADVASEETWVVSVASGRVTGRVSTRWASDLPAVSEDGALLLREGTAVVSRDIRSLDSLGAVVAGGTDLWFVGRWKPTTTPNVLREEARAPTPRPTRRAAAQRIAPRSGAGAPATPSPSPSIPATRGAAPAAAPTAGRVWVQVSVSQNEQASRDLSQELTRSGHAAQMIEPRSPGEGWRVVVGPYATRAAADSAGRLLGRPYYILERGLQGPVRQ